LDGARVNVAYSRSFPVRQLARIVRGFRRDRPNVNLDLREMWSNSQYDAVAAGGIDVGFRQMQEEEHAWLSEHGLVAITIAREVVTLAVPGGHRLATRRQVNLSELSDEGFVLIAAHAGESIRARVLEATQQVGFTPRVVQETSDAPLALGLVSAELGISFVLSSNRDVRIRNVHYLSIVPAIQVSFGAIYRRGYGGRSIEPLLNRLEREEVT
jgi:DNA-binding transcriptional LysR family regulator